MFFESKIFRSVFLLTLPLSVFGQNDAPLIYFNNPSFEGNPGAGIDIPGWYNCGPANETPPDLQPGFFGVRSAARHGNTYLGLVVRQTGTWESVGQRLSQALEINQCYEFSLDLRRDTSYESALVGSGVPVKFTTPARVIIWGGNGYCHKGEVLYQTAVIIHPRWLAYNCRLSPKKGSWSHIIIEAYYGATDPFNPALPLHSNGNILIDNASPIKTVVCSPDKMPTPKPPKPELSKKGAETPPAKPATQVKKEEPAPPKPAETVGKNLKRGKVYRLDKVYFDANQYELKPESTEGLQELYTLLKRNPDIMVEIGGHTNNLLHPYESKALELSTNRAKSVADWLIGKGIDASRVRYKGYGWKKPVEPNTTPEGRKKNQRVEVTILTYGD